MTRNEELEQMEQETRKNREIKPRKRSSTLRKTLKRAAINDVGFVAVSVRGMTQIFDTSFKGLLFIAEIDKTMLDFADSFAAEFGGYTKHSIGDQMFSLGLVGVKTAEKLAIKGFSKTTDITEKVLKKAIMRAR